MSKNVPEEGECVFTYSLWEAVECGGPGVSLTRVNTLSPMVHVQKGLNLKGWRPETLSRWNPHRLQAGHVDNSWKMIFSTTGKSGQTAGRERRRGTRGSMGPLRHAALHLQHFGPSVKFVGFGAVLYVLEEQDTAGLTFNQTKGEGEGVAVPHRKGHKNLEAQCVKQLRTLTPTPELALYLRLCGCFCRKWTELLRWPHHQIRWQQPYCSSQPCSHLLLLAELPWITRIKKNKKQGFKTGGI